MTNVVGLKYNNIIDAYSLTAYRRTEQQWFTLGRYYAKKLIVQNDLPWPQFILLIRAARRAALWEMYNCKEIHRPYWRGYFIELRRIPRIATPRRKLRVVGGIG